MHRRIYEIDLLRGVGVLLMIVYHAAYDLSFFGIGNINLDSALWVGVSLCVQIIFISTTGITAALASNKKRQSKHALYLLMIAMAITGITWIVFGHAAIKFGILHFLATAILITIPLKNIRVLTDFPVLISIAGVLIMIAGFFTYTTSIWWIFLLGFVTADFSSLDFFPLIPWFGLFLQGVALGMWIKKKDALTLAVPAQRAPAQSPSLLRAPWLEKIGSHSLIIYLVHQPVIAGLIKLTLG